MNLIFESWRKYLEEAETPRKSAAGIEKSIKTLTGQGGNEGGNPTGMKKVTDPLQGKKDKKDISAPPGAPGGLEEDADVALKQLFEDRIERKYGKSLRESTLTELEMDMGSVHVSTEWEKWAALSGISAGAMGTAITIASMYAGWEGVAIILLPTLIPALLNPLTLAVGGAVAMRFKPTRKLLAWIFKKFIGEDKVNMISSAVSTVIDKMVSASGGSLEQADAIKLYGKIALWVLKNKEFRGKLKDLFVALKNQEVETAQSISEELDEIVQNIIQNDMLGSSEDQNAEIDIEFDEKDVDIERRA